MPGATGWYSYLCPAASIGTGTSTNLWHPALAFRSGSASKGRMHIFWQKRIRAGDQTTPWWFPSQTSGGSIREDRIVLPIRPGMHWSDAQPVVLPGASVKSAVLRLEDNTRTKRGASSDAAKAPSLTTPDATLKTPSRVIGGGLRFAPAAVVEEKKPREKRVKQKNYPTLVAGARELRDRWLEHVNTQPVAAVAGKYDVARIVEHDIRRRCSRTARMSHRRGIA